MKSLAFTSCPSPTPAFCMLFTTITTRVLGHVDIGRLGTRSTQVLSNQSIARSELSASRAWNFLRRVCTFPRRCFYAVSLALRSPLREASVESLTITGLGVPYAFAASKRPYSRSLGQCQRFLGRVRS